MVEINLKIRYVPTTKIVVNAVVKMPSLENLCKIVEPHPPQRLEPVPMFWSDGILFVLIGYPQKTMMMMDEELKGILYLQEVAFIPQEKYPTAGKIFVKGDEFEVFDMTYSYIHANIAKWVKANFMETIKVRASLGLSIEAGEFAMDLPDAYDMLHASSTDTDEFLKKRYHEEIKAAHPDKARSYEDKMVAEKKTKEINQAWELIKKSRDIR